MWTSELIIEAVGWSILIAGFPLIFSYTRKISRYLSYLLFPRDMLIQHRTSENTVESFLLKQSMIKGKSLTRISAEAARSLGGQLEQ